MSSAGPAPLPHIGLLLGTEDTVCTLGAPAPLPHLSLVLHIPRSWLGISSSGVAEWASSPRTNSGARFSASAGTVWGGFEVSVIGRASIVGTSTLSFRGDPGSIFYIRDDQTQMSPQGASVANSAIVVSGAAVFDWEGLQASAVAAFDIASVASPVLEAETVNSSALHIVGTSSLLIDGGSEDNPAIVVEAASFVQWQSLDAVFGDAEIRSDSRGQLEFGSLSFGPTPSAFNIPRVSRLVWRSTKDVDDDDETEDRRRIWDGAAEAEREAAIARRGVYDEEEFALFSAALAGAYAQYRKELQ